MSPALDRYHRPLRNLRLSVTDRCNLRCGYCMPEEHYGWLQRADLLTFEESSALVAELIPHGVEKVRLTGGEPLLRRDIDHLVRSLRAHAGLGELALTTNGLRLPEHAQALRESGLDRLTVSLDTLRADRFQELTRRDELAGVLRGLDAAASAGFTGTKLNVVVMRGTNDDELLAMLDFARERALEVRFIEYMDVGGATRWDMSRVVSATEIIERIGAARGGVTPEDLERTAAPADRYQTGDGQRFGVIAPPRARSAAAAIGPGSPPTGSSSPASTPGRGPPSRRSCAPMAHAPQPIASSSSGPAEAIAGRRSGLS